MKSCEIAENLHRLRHEIPEGVELVAVSKFQTNEAIIAAYDAGQRVFGESRVQEFVAKYESLPNDIKWLFIGHLQTNKVKQIIGKADLIASVDTERLLELIDNVSAEKGIVSRVLLEVHVAQEETKYGFSPQEVLDYFIKRKFENLKSTHLCGLMGMATNTDDTERIRKDFGTLAKLYSEIKGMWADLRGFDILSMGMSDDFPIAIEEGANMVRVGTAIFGSRK